MIFNSIDFLIFFLLFFFLYWFVCNKSLALQNILILAGSYIFYAWWDWRFLFLLMGSSLLNYILGILIHRTTNEKKKKLFLIIGLIQGLGGLIFFKYYNFFVVSVVDAFASIDIHLNIHVIGIILPLGISFYTFRTISYLIDIKNGKILPTFDWVIFFSYVAFFPSLISGPIDRAKTLIPQLEKKRMFNYDQAADGMRQILWGLFKKLVIADNCAIFTNQIFDAYQNLPASSLLFGAALFLIQLYADFSGYSDMAIGIARLLGFNITKNFDYPFFVQNIAEFWRKWHISLTTWLTDYVFTPLMIAFRDYGNWGLILAVLINFTLIGIWHGASWNFVLFGFLHGCYYIPLILRGTIFKSKKIAKNRQYPSLKEFGNMIGTFILVMFSIVLFRTSSILDAFDYWKSLFSTSIFTVPVINGRLNALITLFFILLLLIVEWFQRDKDHGLQLEFVKYRPLRFGIYYGIIICIVFFGASGGNQFIYFKF